MLESDTQTFGCSTLVNVVPADTTNQNNKSISKIFSEDTLEQAKKQEKMTWVDCAEGYRKSPRQL